MNGLTIGPRGLDLRKLQMCATGELFGQDGSKYNYMHGPLDSLIL